MQYFGARWVEFALFSVSGMLIGFLRRSTKVARPSRSLTSSLVSFSRRKDKAAILRRIDRHAMLKYGRRSRVELNFFILFCVSRP